MYLKVNQKLGKVVNEMVDFSSKVTTASWFSATRFIKFFWIVSKLEFLFNQMRDDILRLQNMWEDNANKFVEFDKMLDHNSAKTIANDVSKINSQLEQIWNEFRLKMVQSINILKNLN